jgi:hypothetical protein
MNIKHSDDETSSWFLPPKPGVKPSPGYEAWLRSEIEAAQAEIRDGKVMALEQVRKEFGLE